MFNEKTSRANKIALTEMCGKHPQQTYTLTAVLNGETLHILTCLEIRVESLSFECTDTLQSLIKLSASSISISSLS